MSTFRLKRPEPSEAQILAAVLRVLECHPKVSWARRMNSGAGRIVRGSGKASQFMRFGFPGCPDIIGQLRGSGTILLIECKRPSGRVSADQSAFLSRAKGDGAMAAVIRSTDELLELLE